MHLLIFFLILSQVFDRIRNKNSATLEKLVCVSGDIKDSNIGKNIFIFIFNLYFRFLFFSLIIFLALTELDYKNLQNNVDIVFHVAATIKFNEDLKHAVNLNTIGTQRILDLCLTMKNLKV